MPTPRDIACIASQKRVRGRIESMQLTPRPIEAARLDLRRMKATQRGYTGPLTRGELSKR